MKTYAVVFRSGEYSGTHWSVVRSFSDPGEAGAFVAECERIYREESSRRVRGRPWGEWVHPLTPQFDSYYPYWSVEEVEHDGLWRTLAEGGA